MWARFDDRFHENRKVKRAWRRCPAAIGLHVMAITYSAGHLTDGFVDADFVEDRMPAKRARDRAVEVLIDAGLWLPADEGWTINDFAEFNETKADIEARRVAKSNAGKKGAAKRWGDTKPIAAAIAPATTTHGIALAKDAPEPEPTRTEPVLLPPKPPKGARQRDRQQFENDMAAWVAANPQVHTDEWAAVLQRCAEVIEEDVFSLHVAPLHLHALDDERWVIGAPENSTRWVSDRFGRIISSAIEAVVGPRSVEFAACGCSPLEAVA